MRHRRTPNGETKLDAGLQPQQCAGEEGSCCCNCAGLTLTEAQNINRSLLELGNVISALMQHSPHVPYR